jgi:nicotinamidase/pyrazinamidase
MYEGHRYQHVDRRNGHGAQHQRPEIDAYSAFLENDRKTETGLQYYLKGLKIDTVYITGLAADYCVYFSALDGRRFGFDIYVVEDATKGIDYPKGSVERAFADMKKQGVKFISHERV